jgi:peptidoglycan/LPS O-acetylase OafA/YrhL
VKPIIIVMLIIQLGVLLATAVAVLRRRRGDGQMPVWSSFAVSLLVVGLASITISGDHAGSPGADVVAFGGPFLIGMGLMAALLLLSQRAGTRGSSDQ